MRNRLCIAALLALGATFSGGCPHNKPDSNPPATQQADSAPAKELLDGIQTDIQAKDWASASSKVAQLGPMANDLSPDQRAQLAQDQMLLGLTTFGGKRFAAPATQPADGTAAPAAAKTRGAAGWLQAAQSLTGSGTPAAGAAAAPAGSADATAQPILTQLQADTAANDTAAITTDLAHLSAVPANQLSPGMSLQMGFAVAQAQAKLRKAHGGKPVAAPAAAPAQ